MLGWMPETRLEIGTSPRTLLKVRIDTQMYNLRIPEPLQNDPSAQHLLAGTRWVKNSTQYLVQSGSCLV